MVWCHCNLTFGPTLTIYLPAWDKLAEEYANSNTALVAEVDCSSEKGKEFCVAHEIEGFPQIRWGDPDNLKDYNGGRSYEDLSKFGKENLRPTCSLNDMDLCDDEQMELIETYKDMTIGQLQIEIERYGEAMVDAETSFKRKISLLQGKYERFAEDREMTIRKIRKKGLKFMHSVLKVKEREEDENQKKDEL